VSVAGELSKETFIIIVVIVVVVVCVIFSAEDAKKITKPTLKKQKIPKNGSNAYIAKSQLTR